MYVASEGSLRSGCGVESSPGELAEGCGHGRWEVQPEEADMCYRFVDPIGVVGDSPS